MKLAPGAGSVEIEGENGAKRQIVDDVCINCLNLTLQYLMKKEFFPILKKLAKFKKPGFGSRFGSAFVKKAGSGSAYYEFRSETLIQRFNVFFYAPGEP
jgi:hypothetical protein